MNKTEGNEEPVKQENKVNSECNSYLFARSLSTHGNSRAGLCGLNAIFYELTVIKIHTSRFLTNQNASTISVLVFNEKIIK